jgi:TPR repeat protein
MLVRPCPATFFAYCLNHALIDVLQGEVRGLAAKGRALLYGIQIPKDEVAAVDLLTKCAKQGDPLGCHLLSVCHEKGLGNLPKDEKAALDLCKRALSMGRVECEACVRRVRFLFMII